jgi:hypothetical protein
VKSAPADVDANPSKVEATIDYLDTHSRCFWRRRYQLLVVGAVVVSGVVLLILLVFIADTVLNDDASRLAAARSARAAAVGSGAMSLAASLNRSGSLVISSVDNGAALQGALSVMGVSIGSDGAVSMRVAGPVVSTTLDQAFAGLDFPSSSISANTDEQRRRTQSTPTEELLSRTGSLAGSESVAALAAAVAQSFAVDGVQLSGMTAPMAGQIIIFAQDLVGAETHPDTTAPLDYALRLFPGDQANGGLPLSMLPLLSGSGPSWLGALRIPLGMGSLVASTAKLAAGEETWLEKGLTFAGFVGDVPNSTAAPFLKSFNGQVKDLESLARNTTAAAQGLASEAQALKFIRGYFPQSFGIPGQEGSEVLLGGGSVEVRLMDTTINAAWLGFPGANLTMGQTRLLVSGLGSSEQAAVALDLDFTAYLGSNGNVVGGRVSGAYNASGAFSVHGVLDRVQIAEVEEMVTVQAVTADVQFISTEGQVLFDHFSLASTLKLHKFGNALVSAAGTVQGGRYGWVTTGNIPNVRDVGGALCAVKSPELCNLGLDNQGLSNVDLLLSLASDEVDIIGVGLEPVPRLDAGIGIRVKATVDSLPENVQRVLTMLSIQNLSAVVTANVPWAPAPACETLLSFAVESEKTVSAGLSGNVVANPPPSGVSLLSVRLSIWPVTCDQRGPEVQLRADMTVSVALTNGGTQKVFFAVSASILPTSLSFTLRGELLRPWLNVSIDCCCCCCCCTRTHISTALWKVQLSSSVCLLSASLRSVALLGFIFTTPRYKSVTQRCASASTSSSSTHRSNSPLPSRRMPRCSSVPTQVVLATTC